MMHALIADKNRNFRADFVELVTHCHPSWQVVDTADAMELRARLSTAQPDIVFLDLELPGLHACFDLAALRNEHPHTKFIGLGDTNESATIIRCFEDGLGGYISRTCTGLKLIRTLKVIATPDIFISTGACEPARTELMPEALAEAARMPALAGHDIDPGHGHALTARQADVLHLLAEGRSTKDIARRLGLAVPTVKTHLAAVYRQLGARNRLQAVVKASSLRGGTPASPTPAMMRGHAQGSLYERMFAAS
jgi:DNA-binding NarL/FixJ family response regulator